MSSMAQPQEAYDEQDYGDVHVRAGDMDNIRPIPRVTIQAFCETESVAATIEATSQDRRMTKAHVKVHLGGIPAAVDFYETAPTPNLIIVESRLNGEALMADLGRLADVCDGETKVIVVGHLNDVTTYRLLIGNGVSDYLIAPLSMADVMNAISDVFVNPENGLLGKLIVFMGSKGGVGSSTVCHNVAWAISSRFQNDVVLTDLDLAFGTANLNLDQDPPQGVAEAVYSPDRVDDILLDRLLAKCAEHLSLLAAPSTLDRTYDFDANSFNQILEVAQRGAPIVAVDLPSQWTSWTRQILSLADEVVITATPDLASLRNTKNLLDTLADLRPNDHKPYLVVNQVGVPKRPEISAADFAGKLGLDPLAVVQFDPALFGTAANNGQMIAESDAKSPTAALFDTMAQVVSGRAELKPEKKMGLDIMGLIKRKKA